MPKRMEHRPNRLIREKSPYLLQHAYNPVDWFPWSPEALMRAKSHDRPILLSIGYSTCHWCHVMEQESFTDPDTARFMNAHFVCIKVDREERPDLDQIYLTAVSAIRGSAGWPLNVFLTPDLKPFYGGTYFPPQRRPGMAAWRDVLEFLTSAWNDPDQRKKLIHTARELDARIREHLAGTPAAAPLESQVLEAAFQAFENRHDRTWGGFSTAPKFPSPPVQEFLFFYWAKSRKGDPRMSKAGQKALDMALHTLRRMAAGGIYDPIGGGFHRYATDDRWRMPHFEKMLYDNAQLVLNYLTAFQISREPSFRHVAEETLAWIHREMTHPRGGFFSAQDADSLPLEVPRGTPPEDNGEKREGAFYMWALSEIHDALGEKEAAIFSYHHGVQAAGNVPEDPHGEFFGKNILFQAHPLEETARAFQIPVEAARRALDAARARLLEVRHRRPAPHLDDKIITAWNGLTISAFARAHQLLEKPPYLLQATRAAEFIWDTLYDEKQKRLFRIWRENEKKIPGMAEDYTAYLQGLIDIYEAGFDLKWLHRAETLGRILMEAFFDAEHGGFFMRPLSEADARGVRIKEIHDGVIPSAASMAALALFRLHKLTQEKAFFDAAAAAVESVVPILRQHPTAAPLMLTAADFLFQKSLQIIIAGNSEDPRTRRMLRLARAFYHPARTLILVDTPAHRRYWAKRLPFIAGISLAAGAPRAYVCQDQTCAAPVEDPEALEHLFNLEIGLEKTKESDVGNRN